MGRADRRVYDGDIERVDVTVGMGAERLPKGFAFSDTAFRIFVLMASRRLNSDRFFTTDFTPQVYTAGRHGVDRLQRHALGAPAPLPGAARRDAGRRQRVRALESRGRLTRVALSAWTQT